MFPVNKVPFGKYLHLHPSTDVAALIIKPDDSVEVRRIKRLIAAMLSPSPESRPSMQQVVNELSEIHMSLCMKILFAVNTAWESPVFCSKFSIVLEQVVIDIANLRFEKIYYIQTPCKYYHLSLVTMRKWT